MIIETHYHEFMNEEKQHMNTKFFLFLQNKRWFRRWNAGILAAVLLFSVILAVPAYAEEEKESFSQVGMDFAIPEEIRVSKGTVAPYQVGAIDEAHHTYAGLVLYFAAPQEDVMRCLRQSRLLAVYRWTANLSPNWEQQDRTHIMRCSQTVRHTCPG